MADKAAHSHAVDEAFRTVSLITDKELHFACRHILYQMVRTKRAKQAMIPQKSSMLSRKSILHTSCTFVPQVKSRRTKPIWMDISVSKTPRMSLRSWTTPKSQHSWTPTWQRRMAALDSLSSQPIAYRGREPQQNPMSLRAPVTRDITQ